MSEPNNTAGVPSQTVPSFEVESPSVHIASAASAPRPDAEAWAGPPRTSTLRRLASAVLICLLATIMLGAGPADSTARFGRLGHKMMCVCGCGQVLIDCNHVGCPDSTRMLTELNGKVADPSDADKDILNWFVAKYGATVLASPIRGGFDNVAWFIPAVCFIFGIFGTAWLVRHFTARRQALAGPSALTPAIDDAMRDRIRRETEGL